MSWLITGGAGYIGAHVAQAFADAGLECVALDSLVSGEPGFVPDGVPLVHADVTSERDVVDALEAYRVTGVVHLAAFKYAGVSVQRPVHTFQQNLGGTATLLAAMQQVGVQRLVFSSTAAVYGTPEVEVVTESTPTNPQSPYGESKLAAEWLIRDQAVATGLRQTSLRYFNVVGSGSDRIRDTSPHNLFPLVFRALEEGRSPRIFGDDYPTPDGTAVRDYVHVADLALAHVEAAKRLEGADGLRADELLPVYNLGSGDGSSVRQIMDAVRRVTGVPFEPDVAPRRPGDPARIVSSGEAAARDLGWAMRHSLDDMVASAWSAWSAWSAGSAGSV